MSNGHGGKVRELVALMTVPDILAAFGSVAGHLLQVAADGQGATMLHAPEW